MNAHTTTTPFAAILESQPPWWRLGVGGVLVVIAYLGMLFAALSLGSHVAPRLALPPAKQLTVMLLDRVPPVPLVSTPAAASIATPAPDARESQPRAVQPIKVKRPATSKPEQPAAAAANPVPRMPSDDPSPPPLAAAAVAASTETGTPAGGALPAAVRGTASGSAGVGTGSAASPAHASNDITVLPFADGMTRPKLVEMVEPQYTREAREANVKGLFLAKCVITTSGALQKCRVVKGLPMMDQAVLSALARWRYTPVIYQGRPVAVDYVIQVRLAGP